MQIVDFAAAHVEPAAQLALQNYNEERMFIPVLPSVERTPDLLDFASQNRGVAAVDGGALLGFFCWQKPWDNHFGLSKGTWSPLHAHGAVRDHRARIYHALYQAAAEKLVSANIFSHSVTLYEHDAEANDTFSRNGFARRCIDAIRATTPIAGLSHTGVAFRQAEACDAETIAILNNHLVEHLNQSPMFMPFSKTFTASDIKHGIDNGTYQYYIAVQNNRPLVYYRIQKSGENFSCDDVSMMNISGAYALPEVRGTGIAAGLLAWLMDWLREHGYTRCGVDFECFNYTAYGFWLKYFSAYINGAIRHIDERIRRI